MNFPILSNCIKECIFRRRNLKFYGHWLNESGSKSTLKMGFLVQSVDQCSRAVNEMHDITPVKLIALLF